MYRAISVEENSDYSLAFVEFDDQGELWAPSQLDRTLDLIDRNNQSQFGMALVLFVHGWNDSASEKEDQVSGGTIYEFRELLMRIKQGARVRFPEIDLPVVGVYLSWRGEVSKIPLIRQLSFYNRRGAAERIAGPPATEAIYRILTPMRANPSARSVLIGHSFGSMILEQALSQSVVAALLAAPSDELVCPAYLVVLVKPAGSAIQTKQLVDILARNRLKTYRVDDEGNRFERPLLISFTSESDNATRRYFPIGMGVKAASKKFRTYGVEYCSPFANQRFLYSHTAGHSPGLFSHSVTIGPKSDSTPAEEQRIADGIGQPRYLPEYDPVTQQMTFSFNGEQHRFTIRRRPRALNDTPYWIMQVPGELIPNHSDIFSNDTFALVEAALSFTGALQPGATTRVHREDGPRPVALVPRPGGGVVFLDRSRGVYALGPESSHPVFLSCLREPIDPSQSIGFHVAGHLAYVALQTRDTSEETNCHTLISEFRLDDDGYQHLGQIRLGGSRCYSAAAFDVTEKRIYLSSDEPTSPQLLVASLSQEGSTPAPWIELPGSRPATVMQFAAAGRRLFSAQAESGEIWVVDTAMDPPGITLITNSLGTPVDLKYGSGSQTLYVTDSSRETLWSIDCSSICGQPEVFLESEVLARPTTLGVALDGTVWLGDLTSQTLTAYDPDGSVRTTVKSLTGVRQSAENN